MRANERNRGFTLLELSLVLVLIGTIVGLGLVTLTAAVQATQYNGTLAKMDAIEKALLNFSTVNHRIPCPGDLTLTSSTSTSGTYYASTAGADYGSEAGADANSAITTGTGVCSGTNMTPQANFTATSGVAEGAVPTRALGLPDDYMYDGWGRRFSYAVDPSATIAGSVPSMTLSCSPITINDGLGNLRSAAAIYAIISHGANGHGAYTSSGAPVNAGSTNTNEWTNCHCNATGASQGYPWGSPVPTFATYVQAAPSVATAGNPLTTFDDIVAYKENAQLQTFNNPVTPSFMYIADNNNGRVREVSATQMGIITTVAGGGSCGSATCGDGGPATSAKSNGLASVKVDSTGNFYIADGDIRIRKVTAATGIITTVAGTNTSGYNGDNIAATSAELSEPYDVAIDSSGNVYIADYGNNRVRKVAVGTGIITTVAGNGTPGHAGDGGPATSAELFNPYGLALDIYGNIYIADSSSGRIRKVTVSTGSITTVAGGGPCGTACCGDGGLATNALLGTPYGIAVDSSGNIYISNESCGRIREVNAVTGIITTIAGNGTQGYSGDYGPATSAELKDPGLISLDSSGNLYIADINNSRIRKVTPAGTICTVAGNGTASYSGDGGPATTAKLHSPSGIAISTFR